MGVALSPVHAAQKAAVFMSMVSMTNSEYDPERLSGSHPHAVKALRTQATQIHLPML